MKISAKNYASEIIRIQKKVLAMLETIQKLQDLLAEIEDVREKHVKILSELD